MIRVFYKDLEFPPRNGFIFVKEIPDNKYEFKWDESKRFALSKDQEFATIEQLLEFYSENDFDEILQYD